MYFFEAPDLRFELIFGNYYEEDARSGNPYNTLLSIFVSAYGYSGKAEWVLDFSEFQHFVCELNEMHRVLRGKTVLKDKGYGSCLWIACDRQGYFLFEGVLVSDTFQKLNFNFQIDQTYLAAFIGALWKDYGARAGF